jgi:hypothetical protein
MAWKRKVHAEGGTTLIETFHFEKQEGVLLESLKQRLLNAGVALNPLPPEAVLEIAQQAAVSRGSRDEDLHHAYMETQSIQVFGDLRGLRASCGVHSRKRHDRDQRLIRGRYRKSAVEHAT